LTNNSKSSSSSIFQKNQQKQQQQQKENQSSLKASDKDQNDIVEDEEEWKLIAILRDDDDDKKKKRTIRSVAFAPTSSTLGVPILATASFDGSVLIWEHFPDHDHDDNYNEHDDDENDSENDKNDNANLSHYFEPIAQLQGHENEIKCLAWNATGSLLATCGRDKTVWIWECYLPGTVGGMTSPSATSTAMSMVMDDTRIGGGGGRRKDQGDGEFFECLAVLQGHDGDVKSIVFGPSHSQWGEGEEVLYSASYDNTIRVWAEESGEWYCAATLGRGGSGGGSGGGSSDHALVMGAVHSSTVWSLGLTPGGVRLFSGSEDGSIAIWKMYTAAERRRLFPSNNATTTAAVSHTDGLWNSVGKLPDAHSTYAVLSIDCAPSRAGHGRVVSGGGDNCINIYREEERDGGGGNSDAPKFTLEAVAIDAHDGDVNCVKWHPRDGTRLVSCGDDGAVRMWRYRRGTAI
jgi:WD40 repeat protein